jgi:hypothetical protein
MSTAETYGAVQRKQNKRDWSHFSKANSFELSSLSNSLCKRQRRPTDAIAHHIPSEPLMHELTQTQLNEVIGQAVQSAVSLRSQEYEKRIVNMEVRLQEMSEALLCMSANFVHSDGLTDYYS